MDDKFTQLVGAAEAQPFAGWDFSYLDGRWDEDDLLWNYHAAVQKMLRGVDALLDIGTGGGEFLASLGPLPARTVATEGYPPNVLVARARLEPLNVAVCAVDDAEVLAFEDALFDLVINRHAFYVPREVLRVLRPGGRFVTQQVGDRNCIELNRRLGDDDAHFEAWSMALAVQQLEAAGFTVEEQCEAFPALRFLDIGAVVYYLKVISWQVPGFSVEKYRDELRALHDDIEANGSVDVPQHRFFISAQKPT